MQSPMKLRPKMIKARLEDLEREREDLLREQAMWAEVDEVTCPKCDKATPIGDATIIEKYFYVEPYSCMAGDYWRTSHDYLYHCKQCGGRSRAYTGSYDYEGYSQVTADSRIKSQALDETRVKLYFLIQANEYRFGERLTSYNEDNCSLEELREHNARRKRNLC